MKRIIKIATCRNVLVAVATISLLVFAPLTDGAVFAKYDGIDGESKDASHDKWIDILSVEWGAHRTTGAARDAVTVDDMTLTMEYDKAAPKLQESCFIAKVIAKLEIEQTATYGGTRATYLRYEFKNVRITSFQTNASGNDEAGPPTVVVKCSFEEIKVTYTEFDDTGNPKGNIEYNWSVPKDP